MTIGRSNRGSDEGRCSPHAGHGLRGRRRRSWGRLGRGRHWLVGNGGRRRLVVEKGVLVEHGQGVGLIVVLLKPSFPLLLDRLPWRIPSAEVAEGRWGSCPLQSHFSTLQYTSIVSRPVPIVGRRPRVAPLRVAPSRSSPRLVLVFCNLLI